MPTGVSLQLFDGSTPRASLAGIQACWWDVTEPKDFTNPIGKSSAVTTDSSGYISLDLSGVTGLGVGEDGFLMLYKLDAADHRDSLIFSGKVTTSTVTSGVDMCYYDSGWTRPTEWPALPTLTVGEQKFAGLLKVYPGNQPLALMVSGDYTVDWGDGTSENVASGVKAERLVSYAGVPGSADPDGAKYAVVVVTMQSGQTFTSLNLAQRHSSMAATGFALPWLDIAVTGASLATLTVTNISGSNGQARNLEQAQLIGPNLVTSFASLFISCFALQSVPVLDTASGTNFTSMFSGCNSLQAIPRINTAAGTLFASMFSGCVSLLRIPLLDTAAGTNFSSMFQSARRLTSVPLLNTAAGTNFSSMLSTCSALEHVPLLNTAAGTNFTSMFSGCAALTVIPPINTSSGLTITGIFNSCSRLKAVPLLDTALVTNFSNVFNNCLSLQTIPLLNTAAGTNFTAMFGSCTALQSIPAINVAAGTGFTSFLDSCAALRRNQMVGCRYAVSYSTSQNLSAAALDEIYTNLGTAAGAQTITVTNNWGTASDTPSIATAKGWTVTG